MATVLFTWELGRGLGHLVPMLPLASGLAGRGHRVFVVARDVAAAPAVFEKAGVSLLPAPFKLGGTPQPGPTLNFAHLLANVGWGEYSELFGLASAWRNLLGFVRPDAIVFDHSPTALLAARTVPPRVAKVVTGLGFFCPPDVEPFPPFPNGGADSARVLAEERRVLARANRWLESRSLPPLARLGQLYGEVDETFLQTFPELDHYPNRPAEAEYWGPVHSPGGLAPQWPEGQGPKVYAYLKDFPALPEVLAALTSRGCRTVVLADGVSPEVRRRCESPAVRFETRRLDLAKVGAECDLAVHNANHGTLCQLLLAGRPMLQLPITLEQKILARAVERLGAAETVPARRDGTGAAVGPKLDALLTDPRYADAARRFAQKQAAFDPHTQAERMVARVEALLDEPRPARNPARVFAG